MNVTIDNEVGNFYLNGNTFVAQGIGYSPTPAGEQVQVGYQIHAFLQQKKITY